jgi:hypothetical protein
MTSHKPIILIFDDDAGINSRWADTLRRIGSVRAAFDVQIMPRPDFRKSLEGLRERHTLVRQQKDFPPEGNPFDNVAILMIDYDLFGVDDKELTAEEVAYLARCYSRCGLIIGINQFGGANPFDLTLRWRAASFADINLGGSQLANTGLWKEPWSGFRPWIWPLLPNAFDSFQHRVAQLVGGLDEPLFRTLGFPAELVDILPRETLTYISVADKRLQDITVRDVVTQSAIGLRRKDRLLDDSFAIRVAASRIAAWLEQCVLPGQDMLVDAPHLAARYPSLLRGDISRASTWNSTTTLLNPERSFLHSERVKPFRFPSQSWLSRPAWYWPLVNRSEEIAEVRDPWSAPASGYVFCEDVSRFLPREGAREFVAAVPSPFVRRFVVDPTSGPGRRFAKALKDIEYTPPTQFAL